MRKRTFLPHRKCGGLFCDRCSNYQISVPEEQLYTPVRVCATCYKSSSHQNTWENYS